MNAHGKFLALAQIALSCSVFAQLIPTPNQANSAAASFTQEIEEADRALKTEKWDNALKHGFAAIKVDTKRFEGYLLVAVIYKEQGIQAQAALYANRGVDRATASRKIQAEELRAQILSKNAKDFDWKPYAVLWRGEQSIDPQASHSQTANVSPNAPQPSPEKLALRDAEKVVLSHLNLGQGGLSGRAKMTNDEKLALRNLNKARQDRGLKLLVPPLVERTENGILEERGLRYHYLLSTPDYSQFKKDWKAFPEDDPNEK